MSKNGNRYRSIDIVLKHITKLTESELAVLSVSDQVDLIKSVYLPYILNGYQDTDFKVPDRFTDVWMRCKAIIEKEARK